jgi:MinD superfamily P-loop ATPase
VSRAETIDRIDDEEIPCGGCGALCREARFGALYFPAGTDEAIAYILCDACCALALNPATRDSVWNSVEVRLGPVRGAA